MNRAHETSEHLQLKKDVAACFESLGYEIIFEHQLVDVLAFNTKTKSVVAIEIERTERNLLNNLRRNQSNGFKTVLVVAPDEKRKQRYERIFSNYEGEFSHMKIKCVSPSESQSQDVLDFISE